MLEFLNDYGNIFEFLFCKANMFAIKNDSYFRNPVSRSRPKAKMFEFLNDYGNILEFLFCKANGLNF